uniref:Uncharacterized protein n=1 Tax=Knipowitschia caucasica TaxID=637954 RepID=A0AAV2M4E2_KNICA
MNNHISINHLPTSYNLIDFPPPTAALSTPTSNIGGSQRGQVGGWGGWAWWCWGLCAGGGWGMGYLSKLRVRVCNWGLGALMGCAGGGGGTGVGGGGEVVTPPLHQTMSTHHPNGNNHAGPRRGGGWSPQWGRAGADCAVGW